MTYGEVFEALNPHRHDPKYSENLLKWLHKQLRKEPLQREQLVVTQSSEWGRYIGHMDDCFLVGTNLHGVLCGSRDRGAFAPKYHGKEIPDFWPNYIANGKCYLDSDHVYYGDRWINDDDIRTCGWCGLQQAKRTVMIEQEIWESADSTTVS